MDPRAYYGRSGDDKWRNDRPATRPVFLPPANWRSGSGSVAGQAAAAGNPSPGYADYYSNTNNYWDKDYYQRNQDYYQRNQGNYQGWTSTQPSYGYGNTGLSEPTSDIGRAMDTLEESAARPAAPQPWYGSPTSTVLARDRYPEALNTRDPGRRYGNYNLSSRPYRAGDGRSEAGRYYSGRTP